MRPDEGEEGRTLRPRRLRGLAVLFSCIGLAFAAVGVGPGLSDPSDIDKASSDSDGYQLGWVDLDGGTLDEAELTRLSRVDSGTAQLQVGGGRPIVLNLWASWCKPCRQELPWLDRLHRSGKADVIGVSRDTVESQATALVEQTNVTYPNLIDPGSYFVDSLHGSAPTFGLPITLLIEDGLITAAHIGQFTTYRELIEPLE